MPTGPRNVKVRITQGGILLYVDVDVIPNEGGGYYASVRRSVNRFIGKTATLSAAARVAACERAVILYPTLPAAPEVALA